VNVILFEFADTPPPGTSLGVLLSIQPGITPVTSIRESWLLSFLKDPLLCLSPTSILPDEQLLSCNQDGLLAHAVSYLPIYPKYHRHR
jgi:hypothetical protein